MPKLNEKQVAQLQELAEAAVNCGNSPDWAAISDTIGAEVNENTLLKVTGAFRWTQEQKDKLRELWIKHSAAPDWAMFAAELKPLKPRQIRSELRHMVKNNPSLPRFE